jgi:hypothetical protein
MRGSTLVPQGELLDCRDAMAAPGQRSGDAASGNPETYDGDVCTHPEPSVSQHHSSARSWARN